MRLVGCLLLSTHIRACLYEPGMGEGRVEARIESRPRPREAHDTGQARPLVVEARGHRVVHSHRLVRQHSQASESVPFNKSTISTHCITWFDSPITPQTITLRELYVRTSRSKYYQKYPQHRNTV
ncbi:hypothetical protein KGM_212044 [Danaus plexippus plexippus]|uniref:Secreted protein n=1 Tax=Danaus plexippus plexippus TaxID=278856 RepID=A0A212F7R0_DANPL|nr:hypothetical protein KGM_212044 [Danaus plexippus plexippus]